MACLNLIRLGGGALYALIVFFALQRGVASATPEVKVVSGEEKTEEETESPPSRAARWLVPKAAPERLTFNLGGGFVREQSAWALFAAEYDHPSGFIARGHFSLEARDEYMPREAFIEGVFGYRWRGLFELGLSALAVAGPEFSFSQRWHQDRAWTGGFGVYSAIGSPEGLRVTVTAVSVLFGRFGERQGASAYALPYELQIPIFAHERARLFIVNRGFFTFPDPTIFTHRIELHTLIVRRVRIFGGMLLDSYGIGGVMGLGLRFGSAPNAPI